MKCFQSSKGGKNSNLRVHVGAVEVDLPSGLVDRAADLGDRGLEHAVRRGVRDHDARQGGRVLLDLRREEKKENAILQQNMHQSLKGI